MHGRTHGIIIIHKLMRERAADNIADVSRISIRLRRNDEDRRGIRNDLKTLMPHAAAFSAGLLRYRVAYARFVPISMQLKYIYIYSVTDKSRVYSNRTYFAPVNALHLHFSQHSHDSTLNHEG